jgi:ribonuclease BN (tRNA processing enzyme)
MRKGPMPFDRRTFLGSCARLGGLGLLGGATAAPLFFRVAAAQAPVPANGTHLVLLGTQGGPNFNTERNESSNAVVVDGRAYLVDVGEGALGGLRKSGLSYRDIGRVFLTHLHDDHSGDVASLLSHQWTDGRTEPTVVAGPYGTAKLVTAALQFAEANATIRLVDEARSIKPTDIFRGEDLEATLVPKEIYRDDRVTVSSIENTHFPEDAKRQMPYRSLSYRFDSRDRSIVFSGDTAYSAGLVRLARGADLFVCEAMEIASMRQAFERMVANGAYADNPEGIWQHIVETHTSTADAGRMAAEAEVGTLVLSHLVPGALQPLSDDVYLAGVREHFDGNAIVGKDLLVL